MGTLAPGKVGNRQKMGDFISLILHAVLLLMPLMGVTQGERLPPSDRDVPRRYAHD